MAASLHEHNEKIIGVVFMALKTYSLHNLLNIVDSLTILVLHFQQGLLDSLSSHSNLKMEYDIL